MEEPTRGWPGVKPSTCEDLSARLGAAIDHFEKWDIRVAPLGRLAAGRQVLERVGKAGRYPEDRSERILISHAISDATDFSLIGESLGEERVQAIAQELQLALKGSVGQEELQRRRPWAPRAR